MIALLAMRLYYGYQVAQTLTVAQLTKHQCEKLVPTGKVFDILVAMILANIVIELASVQERGEL
jgi:hypothetical protein